MDGQLISGAAWCAESSATYDFVRIFTNSGKVSAGDHIIRIPKGTLIGKSRITEDLYQPLYNGQLDNLVNSYEEAVEAALKYSLENLI